MSMERKIILIAGGTASGKTIIAQILKQHLEGNGKTATMIEMDNYYFSIDELPEEKGEDVNWDSPLVIDWKSFIDDLKEIKSGKNVIKSVYQFDSYSHNGQIEYESSEYIIIEGLFALYNEDVRKLASSLIFIDADDDIRLMRRMKRDGAGRYKDSFDPNEFMKKWKDVIKPMHKKFIQPTSEYADFIIRNNKEFIEEEKERMIQLLHSIVVK